MYGLLLEIKVLKWKFVKNKSCERKLWKCENEGFIDVYLFIMCKILNKGIL